MWVLIRHDNASWPFLEEPISSFLSCPRSFLKSAVRPQASPAQDQWLGFPVVSSGGRRIIQASRLAVVLREGLVIYSNACPMFKSSQR